MTSISVGTRLLVCYLSRLVPPVLHEDNNNKRTHHHQKKQQPQDNNSINNEVVCCLLCKKKNLFIFWGLCYSFSCSVIIIIIFFFCSLMSTKLKQHTMKLQQNLYFEEGRGRKVNGIPVLDCSGSGNKGDR